MTNIFIITDLICFVVGCWRTRYWFKTGKTDSVVWEDSQVCLYYPAITLLLMLIFPHVLPYANLLAYLVCLFVALARKYVCAAFLSGFVAFVSLAVIILT